jgi:D-alanyl-D-alanine carboxypeptidase (penicillin-binding protein 5/6)
MNRLFALVLSLTFVAGASAQPLVPPEVAAKSFLVVDLTSNQTLAER